MKDLPPITPAQLRARLEGKHEHAILDVRREGDFAKEHLFFACNVPRSQLELRIERLLPRRDIPITIVEIVESAEDAAEVLRDFGYTDVSVLAGGLVAWTETGGQLFSGVNVPSKAFGEYVETEAATPHVDPKALKEILDSEPDSILLDCRPASEYEAMSIPGAINCPGVELVYRFFSNVPRQTTRVYVNCAGRTRSIIGAQSLIDAGVKNSIYAVRDGAMGWKLAGYALEHGAISQIKPPDPFTATALRELADKRARSAGVRAVSAEECKDLLEDGSRTTYLFDIRDPSEYQAGHLENAISAPGGQLIQTFDAHVAAHNARIILADSDGVRAPTVALWLKQMGIREVLTTHEAAGGSHDPFPTPRLDGLIAAARKISVAEAQAALQGGAAAIFDVATSKDYRSGHIPGARFLERHQAETAMKASSADQFVLTSDDGRLACVVAASLGRPDDSSLVALNGGTKAWREARLPLEHGDGNLPPSPTDVFYRPYDKTDGAESAMRDYLDWEKGLLERIRDEPGVRFSRLAPPAS